MIILLMGAPGAGKGTQSDILQTELSMVHVSSGDLLRESVRLGTELGKNAAEYMSSGKFVPDNLVISMIIERLEQPDVEHGILLDGFPRTLPQAEALDEALDLKDRRVNAVLFINADTEMLLDRLSGRWTCSKCGHVYHEKFAPPRVPGICDLDGSPLFQRDDDKRETAQKRLVDYFEKTMPIIDYYRNRNLVCEVNGDQSVEGVTRDLLQCLR